jgi:hypothetical protein
VKRDSVFLHSVSTFHRRRPPSFYQKVHSYEKDILETAQTLTPSSLATFKAASSETGDLDSQQLIDCCHHVDLWLELIKHQIGLVSLLYRRQEVDTKTRLDVDLHTSRLLDYFQKLRNDPSSLRREDQDDFLPSVPAFIPTTSSGSSSTTRPNASSTSSEECHSQHCKVVKSLQECLEKERKLLEELRLLRVSIKDFNKELSGMNETIWKKTEKLLNILRRRYETQRKEIEKELKDRLRILLEEIHSFLNDGVCTLLEKCSSLLRASTPLAPLPPTPSPSPSTSTDTPPPFLAAITGLAAGGGSGLGMDSSNALRNQMQINSCLVRCREWTEAISAALKEADVVSAVRNRKGAGRSSGARIVLGSNATEQRTGLRIGVGGEGDSECVLKKLEDKVQQLLSRGLEILNQDGGEGYMASFRGGAKKDKRTWRPARNRSASSLN